MSDTPRLAKAIRVERHGRIARIYIDGVEFPYLIADDDIEIGPITPDAVPTIRFTVFADRLDLVNQLDPAPDPELEKHL